jgi:peptidyl-prolyl cis-trans isomerase B (cyclophilin B)
MIKLKITLPTVLIIIASLFCLPTYATETGNKNMIKMTTTHGDIELELFPEAAPETVKNFINYVESGHFDGLIFHRVIPGFMIQGGGFTADMKQRDTQPPIVNEADNGLKNSVGTLSMARTSIPDSATSQFFINLVDNAFLDFTAKTQQGWGYAVFAKVVSGMDVIKEIGGVSTGNVGGHGDVPLEPIFIEKAEVLTD